MEKIILNTIHYITLVTLFSIGYYLGLKIGKQMKTNEIMQFIIKEERNIENERENNKNN